MRHTGEAGIQFFETNNLRHARPCAGHPRFEE
jgi:hypothetical protein